MGIVFAASNTDMNAAFIIESFWQQASNCVTTAYCKALVLTYGFRKSFSKRKIGKGVLITLRDKSSIFFTRREIKRLNIGHKVYFKKYKNRKKQKDAKRIKDFVELFIAIVVKRMQLNGYSQKEYTRTHAIKALTEEGMATEHFHELLGIQRSPARKFLKKDIKKIKLKKAVLLYNDRHIVCVSYGRYNEDTGTLVITDKIPVLQGRKARAWFELK